MTYHAETDILSQLATLYGAAVGQATYAQLQTRLATYQSQFPSKERAPLTERDALLITYGDQLQEPGVPPLQTLMAFCRRHLRGVVSGIHILPFFPYTSDDGFAVTDYEQVNPALGNWDDITALRADFRLMFDAVVNHCSPAHTWFQGFLRGEPEYADFFITVAPGTDLTQVVRPRTSPLLTRFDTAAGERWVWTTFSADQVDLNYANPAVLLRVVDVLLTYVARGAELVRLDAIAYLWKGIGTPCIHLPQTHEVIQCWRAILGAVAPGVQIITETNVPHAENLSYFGDGTNEAQLVYNFALPPLTLHAFQTGNAHFLADWAAGLHLPSEQVTFFNFLASHDGIGLNPVRGILPEAEIAALVARVQAQGGLVSYKSQPDGSALPYELNVNYLDALAAPQMEITLARFLGAHAVLLALVGMPGLYFHSLFGSRGWPAGVQQTGQARTINRQKLACAETERELADPASLRTRVFTRLAQLLRMRATRPAFSPYGTQQVLPAGDAVLAVLRLDPRTGDRVLCLQNVSGQPQRVPLAVTEWLSGPVVDLLGESLPCTATTVTLAPYQTGWLAGSRARSK